MKQLVRSTIAGLALSLASAAHAVPMNFSFQGTFTQDDEVQLFNFTADGSSTVYVVSYAYGGGTQANGTVHARGGFDTILTLFDSTGAFVTDNDDGASACFSAAAGIAGSGGNLDPDTGVMYDTCFSAVLSAGMYTVAVTQYDSFANGPTLADGFSEQGNGNFTATLGNCTNGQFCDVSGVDPFNNRTNVWAYDILNVASADQVGRVPEPGTLALLALGLLLPVAARRRARS